VTLEKDGEDQLGRQCEIRSITMNQGGEEYSTYYERIKDNQLDLSHLAWGLPCKTHWKKYIKRREEKEEDVSNYCKILEFERGRTRSHCAKNKVCKKLWTSRKKINCPWWLLEWRSIRLRSRTHWQAIGPCEIWRSLAEVTSVTTQSGMKCEMSYHEGLANKKELRTAEIL